MKIFVERIIIRNRAPFESLDLTFNENEIAVLTAVNGRGKTTILSHIVDAWHEMARSYFHGEFEGKQNKCYRISTALFNINPSEPSFVYIRFKIPEGYIDYVDIRNNCTREQYDAVIQLEGKIPFNEELLNELEQSNNIKHVSSNFDKKRANSIFENNVITYFPSYRYEVPGYLNDPYKIKLDFTKEMSYTNYLPNLLEVVTGLPQIANWIMDVVLDMEIYKQQPVSLPNGNQQVIDISLERSNLWNNLTKIIQQTLVSKHGEGSLRFGISRRNSGRMRISIVKDKHINGDSISEQFYPTIFNLSSGEAAILCLFGEILRQADKIQNNISLQQITGIVLIDETDKHLHIKLQKEVLPQLFNLFPNVQFIVSSHSPFLNIGFAKNKQTKQRATIIDLDQNGIRIPLQENALYQEVYEMMIGANENYAKLYQKLSEMENKSILFVEDTYTQIYKVAYLKFKELNFDENNMDEIFENNANFYIYGKGNRNNLQGFLNNPCMNEWKTKTIIGLFDFDDAYEDYQKLKNDNKWEEISDDEYKGLYQKRKDCNVYAMMLPIPDFRKKIAGKNQSVKKLEVELLITDEKIKEIFGDSAYAIETIIEGLDIPKIKNKNDFWKKAMKL
jgi:predicted ATP-binding protein involved in virulence